MKLEPKAKSQDFQDQGRSKPMRSPLLLLHIVAGTIGVLSGFVAVFLRKGSRRHGVVGDVFVIAMLCLSSSGAILAIMKSQPGNILGGAFTFCLVATAWMSARRRDGETSIFDWVGLLVSLGIGAFEVTYGREAAMSPTGMKYDYPPGPYFFLGSVALLAAAGDVRLLVRGGISGTQRIARHLWRMCFALFVASGSVFLARQQLFPDLLRKTGVLLLLSFLPLLLMIFWLVRVWLKSRVSRSNRVSGGGRSDAAVRAGAMVHLRDA
jgi:hypothetical protein